MALSLSERFKNSWNAFLSREPTTVRYDSGYSYGYRPDMPKFTGGNRQSIVSSIYNQIAVDVAAIRIVHSRVDVNGKFLEEIDSGLNRCLTEEANIDQAGREFIQDVVMSMLDEGVVAIVPVDTDSNPANGSFDIKTLRTGKIVGWYPEKVRVKVYNDRRGIYQEIMLNKRSVAIVTNPFYSVMNEPNSTMKRLIHKMNLLDAVDEQASSGKLDLIIQLPYTIRTPEKRREAMKRKREIEDQLYNSKYGIAYADGTEKVIQLNRSVENNLLEQVKYLTTMLYNQLGLSEAIFNGTADEATMLNYYNRTLEPILATIADAMKRTFLSRTARTQHQSISYYRDPFKLVPVEKLAEISDKLTRNEILSSNEVRGIIGYKPSDDPRADELKNKNIADTAGSGQAPDINIPNKTDEYADDYFDPEGWSWDSGP